MIETTKTRAPIETIAKSEGWNKSSLLRYFLIVFMVFGSLYLIRSNIPILAFEKAQIVSRTDKCVVLQVSMMKIMDAGFVPSSLIALGRSDRSKWHTAEFEFVDDDSPGSTRPASWVRDDFGLFRWCLEDGTIDYPLKEVFILTQHATSNYTLDENRRVVLSPYSNLRFTSIGPFKLDKLKPVTKGRPDE